MPLAGALAFGAVIGWAVAFVEPFRAGLLYRLCVVLLLTVLLFASGWPALSAVLAGTIAGMFGHDFFAAILRRRTA